MPEKKKDLLQNRQISATYTLSKEETRAALIIAERIEYSKKANLFKMFLLNVLLVLFVYQFFASGRQYYIGLVLAGLCVIVDIVIWLLPERQDKGLVEQAYTGVEMAVEITQEKIAVHSDDADWEVPLDGSCTFFADRKVMVVFLGKGKLLTIPSRAFAYDREHRFAKRMIEKGTVPRERN